MFSRGTAQIATMEPPLEDDPITNIASTIALGFENINVTKESNPKKVILNNVSGYVKCGGITAGTGPPHLPIDSSSYPPHTSPHISFTLLSE